MIIGLWCASNVLREYANNVSFYGRGFIEQVGGYSLDSVAMGHKLRLPRDAWRTLCLREIVHRGVADLALHGFTVVHYRKCERQSLFVVSHNLATRQRHRNPSLGNQNASSCRLCRSRPKSTPALMTA